MNKDEFRKFIGQVAHVAKHNCNMCVEITCNIDNRVCLNCAINDIKNGLVILQERIKKGENPLQEAN